MEGLCAICVTCVCVCVYACCCYQCCIPPIPLPPVDNCLRTNEESMAKAGLAGHFNPSWPRFGDRDRGGVKSPKIRGGLKILTFQGSLNLTLFYRDSKENPQFGGPKSKLSKDNFRGELPPSSVRYVLTPPIPVPEPRCQIRTSIWVAENRFAKTPGSKKITRNSCLGP